MKASSSNLSNQLRGGKNSFISKGEDRAFIAWPKEATGGERIRPRSSPPLKERKEVPNNHPREESALTGKGEKRERVAFSLPSQKRGGLNSFVSSKDRKTIEEIPISRPEKEGPRLTLSLIGAPGEDERKKGGNQTAAPALFSLCSRGKKEEPSSGREKSLRKI